MKAYTMNTLILLRSHVPPPLPEHRLGQILVKLSRVESAGTDPEARVQPECGAVCEFYGLSATVGAKLFNDTEHAGWNAATQHRAWSRKLAPKVLSQPFEVHLESVVLFGFLTERANVDRGRTIDAKNDEDTSPEGRKYRKLIKAAEAYAGGSFLDLHTGNIGWIGCRPLIIDVDGFPGSPRIGTSSTWKALDTSEVAQAERDAQVERKRIKGVERAQKARDAKAKALELGPLDKLLIHRAENGCQGGNMGRWVEFCRQRDLLRSVAREGLIDGHLAAECRRWLIACRDGNLDAQGNIQA